MRRRAKATMLVATGLVGSFTLAGVATVGASADDEVPMATGEVPVYGDFGGAVVTMNGPERSEEEAGALIQVLGAFAEANNIDFTYTGDADWESNINVQVEGGSPPNIAVFPQPGKLADFAREGHLVPLSDAVVDSVNTFWNEGASGYGNVDGVQYGVPVKSDLKSIVWYQPAQFAAAGYEVPQTWDEFTALVDQMAADGVRKPLCVGIESGTATGWPFTDWVEDLVLRQSGPEVYDQWVTNEIPFNDEHIVNAMQTVVDLWTEDNVYASGGSIAATAFQAGGDDLVEGRCWMHRQANFFASFIPAGTPFADGSENAVDVFYFPDINGDRPVLGAGTFAAAFSDDDATMAVLQYLSTNEYATARQKAQAELKGGGVSGFLSAARGQDPSVYLPLEQSFLEILNTAEIFRFDGSDLMPADVGAGTFWTEAVKLVTGEVDAQTAADNIQASWPS